MQVTNKSFVQSKTTNGMTSAINGFIKCVDELKDIVLRDRFPKHVHVRLSVLPGYSLSDRIHIYVCDTRLQEDMYYNYYVGFDVAFFSGMHVWDARVDETEDAVKVLHDLLAHTSNNKCVHIVGEFFICDMDSVIDVLNKITANTDAPRNYAVHLDIESHGERITVKITDPTLK